MFHQNLADLNEAIQFGKDAGLCAGFLFLTITGPGAWSAERFGRRFER